MILTIPTYPLRPINGGPLDRARPKRGEWIYEPKINGWRAIVNTKTGDVFNRHGKLMSITHEFEDSIAALSSSPWEWLDCEGLARRHNIERGKLYVLDYIPESYDKTPWIERHASLREQYPDLVLDHYSSDEAMKGWGELQEINKTLGCEFYEGFVAKRTDSPYPHQLRSSTEETTLWIKHRWEF